MRGGSGSSGPLHSYLQPTCSSPPYISIQVSGRHSSTKKTTASFRSLRLHHPPSIRARAEPSFPDQLRIETIPVAATLPLFTPSLTQLVSPPRCLSCGPSPRAAANHPSTNHHGAPPCLNPSLHSRALPSQATEPSTNAGPPSNLISIRIAAIRSPSVRASSCPTTSIITVSCCDSRVRVSIRKPSLPLLIHIVSQEFYLRIATQHY